MNPHEKIWFIAGMSEDGMRWKISQEKAIEGIESGKWEFYISDIGETADIIVATTSAGDKYIKTLRDNVQPESLMILPECPV